MPLVLMALPSGTESPLAVAVLQTAALAAVSGAAAAPGAAGAGGDNPAAPLPKVKHTMTGQAGLVISRGNSNTQTANAKFELVQERSATKDDFEVEGLYGRTSGISTAERIATTDQRNWNLTDRTFWFGNLHFEKDLFSGFAYQGNIATGIGYKLRDSADTKLTVQIGVGYGRVRPEQLVKDANGNVIARIDGRSEDQAVGNARLLFAHDFNANTRLTEQLNVVSGSTNTRIENNLALVVKMNRSFSLSADYTFRRNTNPPAPLVKNDQLTTLNVVYETGKP